MDYQEFEEYLGKKTERPMPKSLSYRNHTRLVRVSDDAIAIRQHETEIVTLHRDNTYELNSGGWRTVTTKARMNEFTPFRIFSKRGVWYVGPSWYDTTEFFDGIMLTSDGKVLNPPDPKIIEARKAERKEMLALINKYVKGYVNELKQGMPTPDAGDCWLCSMFHDDSESHFLSHFEEEYYVPSLAVNALRERGYKDIGILLHLNAHDEVDGHYTRMGGENRNYSYVGNDIRRYLKKRLVKDVQA